MLSLIREDLADYVEQHTSPVPELLRELREETLRDLPYAQMQVGRVEGTLLRMLVHISGARRVLELGTFSGYSALCMASALPDDGKLVTCDIDPVATAVARKYFERSPHGGKIELRLGDAAQTLDELSKQAARFDFVFIDADKESYVRYWDAVIPMLPMGGIVVADNTLWSGKVLHPTSTSDRGIVAFNDRVAADDRVEHVLLSVRDGIMIARKVG
jgi:caffeoyl-CoA O-methyltransferase